MKLQDTIVVVTGGAGGLGRALVAAAVDAGAATVVVHDRDLAAAEAVAALHPGRAVADWGDLTDPAAIPALVSRAEARFGRIDLFVSNAGFMVYGGVELPDEVWQRSWTVHVMAHVAAARAALPGMLARGRGHFLTVASAAGMLTAPGAAPYTATKHAALGLAEWLAVTYGGRGIGVTALCPEAIETPMLTLSVAEGGAVAQKLAEAGTIMTADAVARAAIAGVEAGRFLVSPHPHTLENTRKKWSDPDRWLAGLRRFVGG